MLGFDQSLVQIAVPVSYRFHIHVRDAWKLETQGNRVVVHAPVLRPALPPAIHTDELQRLEQRGWCRLFDDGADVESGAGHVPPFRGGVCAALAGTRGAIGTPNDSLPRASYFN